MKKGNTILNNLIETLKDAQEGFKQAAESISDRDRQERERQERERQQREREKQGGGQQGCGQQGGR
jgi:hypothetical protein